LDLSLAFDPNPQSSPQLLYVVRFVLQPRKGPAVEPLIAGIGLAEFDFPGQASEQLLLAGVYVKPDNIGSQRIALVAAELAIEEPMMVVRPARQSTPVDTLRLVGMRIIQEDLGVLLVLGVPGIAKVAAVRAEAAGVMVVCPIPNLRFVGETPHPEVLPVAGRLERLAPSPNARRSQQQSDKEGEETFHSQDRVHGKSSEDSNR
jgi:hypothetical protein